MHAPQFLTSFGEQIVVLNSIISTKSVCNHSRSPSPWLKITVELPTRTRPPDVAKFVGAVQKFINDRENDWTSVFIFITGFDADRATMKLDVWLGATNPYQEWNALYSSRSRVLLFIHAYIVEAGHHIVRPAQPLCALDDVGSEVASGLSGFSGLAGLLARSRE
mmetsp:Transcript_86480/g.244334  ORF Transcript_86480/g.244334 Transcript_86480/m.244334 type:complete len:164 (-) Transcript_86480:722-1213(-)